MSNTEKINAAASKLTLEGFCWGGSELDGRRRVIRQTMVKVKGGQVNFCNGPDYIETARKNITIKNGEVVITDCPPCN